MDSIVIEAGGLARIADLAPKAHAFAVISDSNVAELYAQQILSRLPNATLFNFPAGEANKTRDTWAALSDQMLERQLGRDTCVIAMGGGVTTDLAGFVAATYMRGVPVVQVPTTLLAMIDAAIGGKTGVDTEAGKNLVGAFHDPVRVIIDPNVLQTLPDDELSGGLAEAIKHGAIADRAYLEWIVESATSIFERDAAALEQLIRRSVEIKLDHVRDDPRERGKRSALNFGHTIGHAIEREFDYGMSHGQAVALGMIMESHIGVAAGVTSPETPRTIIQAVAAVNLPQFAGFDDFDGLMEATRGDKKARTGAVRYTLLAEPGAVARTPEGEWTITVGDDIVRETLKRHWRV